MTIEEFKRLTDQQIVEEWNRPDGYGEVLLADNVPPSDLRLTVQKTIHPKFIVTLSRE